MGKPWEQYSSDATGKPWEQYQDKEPQERTTGEVIADIPQAVGKTARVFTEGLVGVPAGLANIATTVGDNLPMGKAVNAAGNLISPQYSEMKDNFTNAVGNLGSNIADAVGLPQYEGSTERVIAEGAKLGIGTGGIIKGANALSKAASPATQKILAFLSNAPKAQVAGAVGSGVGGQLAKEAGAGPIGQVAGAVAGGLAGAGSMSTAGRMFNTTTTAMQPTELQGAVNKVLRDSNVNIGSLPKEVQTSITDDIAKALNTGGTLSPDAVKRLADYRTTGLTPMTSSLTLNPADVTKERNLVKLSANSKDPAAQALANNARDNDIKLINGLNTIGGNAEDSVTAANKIIQTLNVKDNATKKIISDYYNQAKNTTGRSAQLDHVNFTNTAADALDSNLLTGALPEGIKSKLNDIAQGKIPLTVDVAEQLKTAMGTVQRNSNDGNVRAAIGKVREALDNTPLMDGQGQEAINAFNKARSAHKAYMQMVEKTPALKAVRDGVEPDKFIQTYIVGNGAKSNIADVQALKDSLKGNDEAVGAIRGQIVSYLKSKATSGNADEVANFSSKGYNQALKNIGDEKLSMFLSDDDIKMLKAIGRVSSYEKFQPTGSAVNNSNTSAALLTAVLDKVANSPMVRKIPLGGLVANQAQDVSVAIGSRKALNPSKAIISKPATKPRSYPLSTAYGSAAFVGNDGND